MQAVILAAGKSSRFYPLTNGIHKSMVKICGKPILEYTIMGLKKSGIEDIVLVVDSTGLIKSYFGDGEKFGVSIKYCVQPKALGAGNGLLLAKDDIKGDFLLLNGSHLEIEEFAKSIIDAKSKEIRAVILVKEKENTWENGVVRLKGDRLDDLIEKPKKGEEPSKLCVVGIYYFTKDFVAELEKIPQEHYQLEAAISSFAKKNYIKVVVTTKETVSLKYSWDLLTLKDFIFKSLKGIVGKNVNIAKSAEIIGPVVIEDNVTIMEGVRAKGPCYIGKNVVLGNNALLRNGVDIEEGSVIGSYMEVKNSLIMEDSTTHSGFIGDSVIGKNCKIGAQFCTANVKLDRKTIEAVVQDKKVDTGLKYLGVLMGDNVIVGIKSSTMPGIIIGQNSVIGPSTIVLQNVGSDTRYYSKFQEVITKKKKNKIVLFDIDYTLFNTDIFKQTKLQKHSVYNEVYNVLEELSKVAKLGIFSEGNISLQKTKLRQTKIHKYFSPKHTHIVEIKEQNLKKIFKKYKNDKLFLVDDKLTILYIAKKISQNVFTIWVKRGIYAEKQKPIPGFKPDKVIRNLQDIVRIVKEN